MSDDHQPILGTLHNTNCVPQNRVAFGVDLCAWGPPPDSRSSWTVEGDTRFLGRLVGANDNLGTASFLSNGNGLTSGGKLSTDPCCSLSLVFDVQAQSLEGFLDGSSMGALGCDLAAPGTRATRGCGVRMGRAFRDSPPCAGSARGGSADASVGRAGRPGGASFPGPPPSGAADFPTKSSRHRRGRCLVCRPVRGSGALQFPTGCRRGTRVRSRCRSSVGGRCCVQEQLRRDQSDSAPRAMVR